VLFSDPARFLVDALFLVPGLILGLVLHEFAHARVAVARGDQTPRIDGRLSLNPRNHLDPLGTIAVFLIQFGWAKPVRINPYRMQHRFDPALVAAAGPLTNLLIAVALSIPLKLALVTGALGHACQVGCAVRLSLLSPPGVLLFSVLLVAFYLNIILCVFNILPIPPLDGYNLVATLLRRRFPKFFFQIDMNRQVIMLVLVVAIFILPSLPGLGFPNLVGILIATLYEPVSTWLLGVPVFPVF